MSTPSDAKGARKVALDLMGDIDFAEREVVDASLALAEAKRLVAVKAIARDGLRWKLKDLIAREMPSMGSDDGK